MSDMSESQRRLVKQRTSARQAAQQDAAGSARKHRRRKYGGRADLVLSPMRRPEWADATGDSERYKVSTEEMLAHKEQRTSKHQLEAKYALKFKRKKDRLDKRAKKLAEREAAVLQVEAALQTQRKHILGMQDRLEQQIQQTERQQLELSKRRKAVKEHAERVELVETQFEAREATIHKSSLALQGLRSALESQREATIQECSSRLRAAEDTERQSAEKLRVATAMLETARKAKDAAFGRTKELDARTSQLEEREANVRQLKQREDLCAALLATRNANQLKLEDRISELHVKDEGLQEQLTKLAEDRDTLLRNQKECTERQDVLDKRAQQLAEDEAQLHADQNAVVEREAAAISMEEECKGVLGSISEKENALKERETAAKRQVKEVEAWRHELAEKEQALDKQAAQVEAKKKHHDLLARRLNKLKRQLEDNNLR